MGSVKAHSVAFHT